MTEQQKRRKVGRPRLDFKKKYTQVRVYDDLADEMRDYLITYSRKVRLRVTMTGFTELAIWKTGARKSRRLKKSVIPLNSKRNVFSMIHVFGMRFLAFFLSF